MTAATAATAATAEEKAEAEKEKAVVARAVAGHAAAHGDGWARGASGVDPGRVEEVELTAVAWVGAAAESEEAGTCRTRPGTWSARWNRRHTRRAALQSKSTAGVRRSSPRRRCLHHRRKVEGAEAAVEAASGQSPEGTGTAGMGASIWEARSAREARAEAVALGSTAKEFAGTKGLSRGCCLQRKG